MRRNLLSGLLKNKALVGVVLAVVALGAAIFVGLAALTIYLGWNLGKGALSYFNDAPQQILVLAKEAANLSPDVVEAAKRKIACVGLIGGPSGNWMFEQASKLATTDAQKQQLNSLGERLGLPTAEPVPTDQLFGHCVGNLREFL